jgi:hypothetical protein
LAGQSFASLLALDLALHEVDGREERAQRARLGNKGFVPDKASPVTGVHAVGKRARRWVVRHRVAWGSPGVRWVVVVFGCCTHKNDSDRGTVYSSSGGFLREHFHGKARGPPVVPAWLCSLATTTFSSSNARFEQCAWIALSTLRAQDRGYRLDQAPHPARSRRD